MSVATVEVRVPKLAESIADAVLAEWLKPDGASVRTDEPVATLETDKAALEIAAPESGVLRHARAAGEHVTEGDVLARIEAGGASGETKPAGAGSPAAGAAEKRAPAKAGTPSDAAPKGGKNDGAGRGGEPASTAPPVTSGAGAPPSTGSPAPSVSAGAVASEPPGPTVPPHPTAGAAPPAPPSARAATPLMGAGARQLIDEHGLDPANIRGTGLQGRILREDVLRVLGERGTTGEAAPAAPATAPPAAAATPPPSTEVASPRAPAPTSAPPAATASRGEHVAPMSRIRQRIAERLVEAQRTAAILTTFNEVDMTAVLEARRRYRESFEKRHGVRLGLLSFFTRACVLALREIPELNAEIRGTDIVIRDWVHMGIAVGTDRGLVVPVVRDADQRDFASIEREIARLAERARSHSLALQELMDGTFTISNGGVYGSLLSTPILNPPQSGILGLHKIEKRPIAVDDQVVVRPMMYLALSYDHRIVDGEQAVTFLVRVKERIEAPDRMLLDV